MLLIPCPWCGPRDEIEFRYGGQAHVSYPADPEALSDEAVGRLPLHARQPSRLVVGAMDARRRVAVAGSTSRGTRPRTRSGSRIASVRTRRPGDRPMEPDAGDSPRRRATASTAPGRSGSRSTASPYEGLVRRHPRERAPGQRRRGRRPFAPAGATSWGLRGRRGRAERVRGGLGAGVPPDRAGDRGPARRRARRVVATRRRPSPRRRRRSACGAIIDTCTSRRSWSASAIAGLRAALQAAESGDRVMLVDERSWIGGTATTGDDVDGEPALPWVATTGGALASASEVTVLTDATALGVYDDGYVVVYERSTAGRTRPPRAGTAGRAGDRRPRATDRIPAQRPARRDARLGRGAVRRPLRRAGGAARRRVQHESRRARDGDGARSPRPRDRRDRRSGRGRRGHRRGSRPSGIDVRVGWSVLAANGDARVRSVTLVGPGGEVDTLDADLVLVSGGWNPTSQLWRGIGGGLRWDVDRTCFVPDGIGPTWLSIVGAAAGDVPSSVPYWYTPADDLSEHFVDLQRDSTVADVLDAVGHELRSTEHVKRATYIGTAIDQGRTSGALTAAIVNEAWGEGPGAQGPTNSRPPYTPVPYSVLAGPDRGPTLLDPVRTTPMHERHVERGAVFENVGQWKRPWYFPLPGESMHAAVERECLAVRRAAGVMDASTLGAIELVGPDAGAFLDRLYTNRMSTLAVGVDPLRADARARRHGARRRCRDASGRGPLPDHDHDGRRRNGDGSRRGVPADRVARPAGLRDERHRAVGDDRGERAGIARRALRSAAPTSTSRRRRSRS